MIYFFNFQQYFYFSFLFFVSFFFALNSGLNLTENTFLFFFLTLFFTWFFPTLFLSVFFCPALTKVALDLHVNFCLSVRLFVFPVFFSWRQIGWYTAFWQWFWQPIYPTRCSELGWAVPHSDFLAWLSSATLKNFISGVSSRILMQ